ncbi:Syntaxin-binding protein 5-like [Varanus komodoensis]|nr:Syntaxin-binding protein 5-like [Varanus komodoensis]
MKKFNFHKVLDGLTSAPSGNSSAAGPGSASVHSGGTAESLREEIQETLTSDYFQICKTVRHGFPYLPTTLAFDPVQKILAIGTRTGAIRILGRPGVDCYCEHESGAAVLQLQFLINEGALVSASSDDMLHLWNLRQKRPAILHSLKFNRERNDLGTGKIWVKQPLPTASLLSVGASYAALSPSPCRGKGACVAQ